MKIIEKLSNMIAEELDGAEHYAECALKHKDEYKSLSDTLYSISTEEMRHVNMLHNEVVKLIEQYRREQGEPPAEMLAVYDYLHKKQITKAKEVKVLQELYKES